MLFPHWAAELGLPDAQLTGVDLPLRADPSAYRQVVSAIKAERLARGALITSHKVDLLTAARDLIDRLDRYAQLCGEVSCLTKRGEQLVGLALDPVTTAAALAEFVPTGHWQRSSGHALCLGAGGAGLALLTAVLLELPADDRPPRVVLVDRDQGRLDHVRQVAEQLNPIGVDLDLRRTDRPEQNAALLETLPPGSLVVNATGMGKDTPGSPLTDAAQFPRDGLIWELNYRGELTFLQQARAQEQARALVIADGWHLFLINWARILGEVFSVEVTDEKMAALARLAAPHRPGNSL